MRKTHREMLDAFLARHPKLGGNDEVKLYHGGQPDDARVVWFYHEHDIALINGSNQVVVSLCGYGTASTRARLNAVCSVVAPHIYFTQIKGEQYMCYTGTDGEGNRWEIPEKITELSAPIVIGEVCRAERSEEDEQV